MADTGRLVDIARQRGIQRIIYFHTDHFEPWSAGVTSNMLRGLERFAKMSRQCSYGRRQSLFYLPHNPHNLAAAGTPGRESRDLVTFVSFDDRSEAANERIINVIRPLFEAGFHEAHLHVHHERWVRNSLNSDSPVWRWVNEHSTPAMDAARLTRFIRLALNTLAKELGRRLDRWAFVHGNWALNGSDDEICRVEEEIALLMQQGCSGDFTFPAGRPHCDPKLEQPFTCLPVHGRKSYDLPAAKAQPVDFGSRCLSPERFFIWNSPLKAPHSSIDWYYTPNLETFRAHDQLIETWFRLGVMYADTLFLKTHAHSVSHRYSLWEEGQPIPHTHPDIVNGFDALSRVCDAGHLLFMPMTVNEVMHVLRAVDRAGHPNATVITRAIEELGRSDLAYTEIAEEPLAMIPRQTAVDTPPELPAKSVPPQSSSMMGTHDHDTAGLLGQAAAEALRRWIASQPERRDAIGSYYEQRLFASDKPLNDYELSLIAYIYDTLVPGEVELIEVGCGFGLMAVVLAQLGHRVTAIEADELRYAGLTELAGQVTGGGRLTAVKGMFPHVGHAASFGTVPRTMLLMTNVVHSTNARNQDLLLRVMAAFDDVVVHTRLFARSRSGSADRASFEAALMARFHVRARLPDQDGGHLLHLRPDRLDAAAKLPGPLPADSGARGTVEQAAAQVAGVRLQMARDEPRPDALYEHKLRVGGFIERYELAVAAYLLTRFPERDVRVLEVGTGQGGFLCLMGLLGFPTVGFEMNMARFGWTCALVEALAPLPGFRIPELHPKVFPRELDGQLITNDQRTIVVCTNLVTSYCAENQDLILRGAMAFDELILDLGRFGAARDQAEERADFLSRLTATHFDALALVHEAAPNEYWSLASRRFAVS